MATITLYTGTYATLTAEYSYSQSIPNNTSTLTISMYITPSGGAVAIGKWGDSGSGSYLGTTSDTFNGTVPENTKSKTLLRTISKTITHNSDGTSGGYTVYWKLNVSSSWGGFSRPQGSFHVGFTTIPRTSNVSLGYATRNVGETQRINFNRASSSFSHAVYYSINQGWVHIGSSSSTYLDWTIAKSFANSFPSSTSFTMHILLETYSGGTYIGATQTSFTTYIPNNTDFQPGVPSIATSIVDAISGYAVSGVSKVKAVSSSTATYGSAISSYAVKINNVSFSGSNVTSGVISTTGSVTVSVTATNSRGYQRSNSTSVTFIHDANAPTRTPSSVNIGGSTTISHVLANSNQTRIDSVSLGNLAASWSSNTRTWTFPTSLANNYPNQTSFTGTYSLKVQHSNKDLRTYSLSTTVNIPNNATYQPNASIGSISVVNPPSFDSALNGLYIKGFSKVASTVSYSGNYGATISSRSLSVAGTNYTLTSGQTTHTSGILASEGAKTVQLNITDSRGYVKSASTNFTVLDYVLPKLENFTAGRDPINESLLNVNFGYTVSSLKPSTSELNRLIYKVEYCASGESWATAFQATRTTLNEVAYALQSASPILNEDKTYEVRLTISDRTGSEISMTQSVPSGFTLMHFSATGKGIGIGQISTKDALEINIPVEVSSVMKQEGYNVLDTRYNPSMSVAWGDITGKPSTFAPSSHTHTQLDIVDVRTYNSGGAEAYSRTPAQVPARQLTTDFGYFSGAGSSWRSSITMRGWYGSGYAAWQLIGCANTPDDDLYLRTGEGSSWRTARLLYHSGNKPYIAQSRWGSAPSNPVAGDIYFTA